MRARVGNQKARVGRVISDKMDKTVVVAVERRVHHPMYVKSVRRRSTLKAHDENNSYRVGDLVRVVEVRPVSRDKRWRVTDLLARPELSEAAADVAGASAQGAEQAAASGAAEER